MHRDMRPVIWVLIVILVVGFGSFMALSELRRNQDIEARAVLVEKENRRILAERDAGEKAEEQKSASYSGYEKLAKALPVNVLVIGDSIGLSSGASTSQDYWYNKLAANLKARYASPVVVKNLSVGGTSSYFGYGELMQLGGAPYDIVILCFGQNDPQESFRLYYETLMRNVVRKYPNSNILSIMESSQRTVTPNIAAIAEIARHYGAVTVDTISAFAASGKPYETLTTDGTHPNDAGYDLYFKAVASVIASNVESAPPRIDLPEPLNPDCRKFDNFTFVPLSEMEQRADGYYYVTQKPAVIGWSYMGEPEGGDVSIYINGALSVAITTTHKYTWAWKRTEILSSDAPAQSTVRIALKANPKLPTVYGLLVSSAD